MRGDYQDVLLGDFCTHLNNGLTRRGSNLDGSIVLRLVELQEGFIDYSSVNRISLSESEKEKFLIHSGDILFARVNGNRNNVGRCASFSVIDEPVYHNDHIIRATVSADAFDPAYLVNFINGPMAREQIEAMTKTSAGQYTINQDGIRGIHIPKPPLDLQREFASFCLQVDKSKYVGDQITETLLTSTVGLIFQFLSALAGTIQPWTTPSGGETSWRLTTTRPWTLL